MSFIACRSASLLVVAAVVSLGAADRDLRLVDAAERHDTEAVGALVKQHIDVNAPQPDGATALHWAAHWDDVEMADVLIRAGAAVNAANDHGATPLWLACSNGNAALTKRLLTAGANANAALPTGETPLMAAARSGNLDLVAVLLEHGAAVNAKETKSGQTPLMWAAAQVHPAVTHALIANKADVHLRSAGGFTALLFAARQGDTESARALIAAGADVNETAPGGSSALLIATASAQEATALLLLEKGADANLADSNGYTPLHAVVWKATAKVGLVRPNGSSALVTALVAHGANPNVQIARDPPPLPGSYIYTSGLTGATPLWLAAKAADRAVMRALVTGGADLELRNKAGSTPLMVAAGLGQTQGPGGVPESRLLDAVKVAVELGADLNAVNDVGQTAVHGAAAAGFNTIIQFLADSGATLDVKDKRGQTPLASTDRRNSDLKSTADLLRKLTAEAPSTSRMPPAGNDKPSGTDPNNATGIR
jgi:ankyrin repeat protein